MKTILLLSVLLTGCESMIPGVEISDAERETCKAETCAVWTPDELQAGVKSL
jgi:hypothetical protein